MLVFLTYLLFTKYRYWIDIVDILQNRIDIESKLKSSHRVITSGNTDVTRERRGTGDPKIFGLWNTRWMEESKIGRTPKKTNGIEKGELNCNNLSAYSELLVRPKCICGCAAAYSAPSDPLDDGARWWWFAAPWRRGLPPQEPLVRSCVSKPSQMAAQVGWIETLVTHSTFHRL